MVVNYQFKELKYDFYKFIYNGLQSTRVPSIWERSLKCSGVIRDASRSLSNSVRDDQSDMARELCGDGRCRLQTNTRGVKHGETSKVLKYIFHTPLGFVVMFHPLREWFPSYFSGCKTLRRTVKDWDRGSTTFLATWYLLYLHLPSCDAPRLQVPGSKRIRNWDHFNQTVYLFGSKNIPGTNHSTLSPVDECFIHSWLTGFKPPKWRIVDAEGFLPCSFLPDPARFVPLTNMLSFAQLG